MSNATIKSRNRVYKWLVEQDIPLNQTTIGRETGTLSTIKEILNDLVKIKLVKIIQWRGDYCEYLVN